LIERHDLATLAGHRRGRRPRPDRQRGALPLPGHAQLLSQLALRSDTRFYDQRLAVVDRIEEVREQLPLTIAAGLPTGPEDAE